MTDFFEYLKKKRIPITVFQIIVCSIIYWFRENRYITPLTVVFINLIAAFMLVLLLYRGSRKNHIRWSYILWLLSMLFIFNRLYDSTAFIEMFHFKQLYFFIVLGIISIFVVTYPYLKRFVRFFYPVLSKFLGNWVNDQAKQDEQRQQETKKRQQKAEQKRKVQPSTAKFASTTETSKKTVDTGMTENTPVETIEGAESQGKSADENRHQVEMNGVNQRANLFSIIITLFFLIAIMIVLLVPVLFNNEWDIVDRITSENLFTVVLSLAAIIMLLMFLSGLIVSLVAKWIQIVIDIKNNRSKGGVYFLYACGLFLISQYIYTHYSPTLDDSANLLLDGKIFTFPLILSILFPLFIIFTENLVALFSSITKNETSILGNCTNHIVKILKNILESTFSFIEFVTSDFLGTIIELAEKDDEIFYDDDAP